MNGRYSMEIDEPASWILAIISLSIAFGGPRILDPNFYASPIFVGVLIGFIGHELMHRTVAVRYGYHARFIAYIPGILVTVATGFIPGLVILAPGYVGIIATYYSNPRGTLYSVAAGPAFNILVAALSLATTPAMEAPMAAYARIVAWVNAWMAFFNLIPIPPLDGSKILRWNPTLWALLIGVSVALLAASG